MSTLECGLLWMIFTQLQASHEVPESILSVTWLESQASFLLEQMLQQCRTQYELGKLIQLFADTDTVLPHGKENYFVPFCSQFFLT